MKFIIFIIFCAVNYLCFSQELRIGVFRDYSISRAVVSYTNGSFSVYADTSYIGTILPNEYIELKSIDNKVELFLGTVQKGKFTKVWIYQNIDGNSVTITPKDSKAKPRKYQDNLEVTCQKNKLSLVNIVEMDHYLAGVVESEGGGGRDLDYYKVQAVCSRTYAIKNKARHAKEGFELCDRVHCQAYHSQLRFTALIESAVQQTRNEVLVDYNGKLIDTYFHANCGGQTSQASYVWHTDISYLNSFIDTFCIYTAQSRWTKTLGKTEFLNFIQQKYFFPTDSLSTQMAVNFKQENRLAFFLDPIYGIPLRDLREQFNLKSTLFSIREDGEQLILEGRGYGHGVGMCQEGAMKMAQYHYSYIQILKYYYPFVEVSNLHFQKYFKQKVNNSIF